MFSRSYPRARGPRQLRGRQSRSLPGRTTTFRSRPPRRVRGPHASASILRQQQTTTRRQTARTSQRDQLLYLPRSCARTQRSHLAPDSALLAGTNERHLLRLVPQQACDNSRKKPRRTPLTLTLRLLLKSTRKALLLHLQSQHPNKVGWAA